jgi:hypothetical protein
MTSGPRIDVGASPRTPRIFVLALVALPILLNAIALFPEVTNSTPSDNDQIFHYLFIERANQALAAGDNPVDHWLPEVEAGFPQFLFYQNLPHLTVVALHHLLFEQVSLLTLLNLVRYLLMVLFPLTVYWSMRRMEFSTIAAAVGAAFCTTLASLPEYGFDYHSYIWHGLGMFPQLCSMHLMFLGAACLYRVLERSKGYAAAIITSSAIVLSDLLYGYIFAITALLLWLLSMLKQIANAADRRDSRGRISRLTARFAIVAVVALLITAYQTVPFLHQVQFINRENAGGLGGLGHPFIGLAGAVEYFLGGYLFDDHRLPIVTVLVVLGIVSGLMTRREDAKIALGIFATYLILCYGRAAFRPLFVLLPAASLVPFVRFGAGVDFGAILLAGLGGELIWNWWPWNFYQTRTVAPFALLLLFCTIALGERWAVYGRSQEVMLMAAEALQDDTDLAEVLSALKAAPPGRVYAGSRGNWGTWMRIGEVHLFDLLPIDQFDTVMPWQNLSLNSPYLWRLDMPDETVCRLFNIRYVVAPRTVRTPKSYRRLLTTSSYILYEVDTGGYLQLGQIEQVFPMATSSTLHARNRDWIASDAPARSRFLAFLTRRDRTKGDVVASPDSGDNASQLGVIENETITPDSFSAQVTPTSPALLVFKTTYHPNWHVSVDGREQHSFMVSPSFIGILITPGRHEVRAEYRSSELKKMLMILSCITLIATIAMGALDLEPFLFGRFSD